MKGLKKIRPLAAGTMGSLLLIAFYVATLSLANSFEYALSQFVSQWMWFTPLIIGFGVQIGLYVHVRRFVEGKRNTAGLAVSSGMSGGAMIACCLHHLVDILPIMGMSLVAAFFTEYQVTFIILGIVSTLFGVTTMLVLIQEGQLYKENSLLSYLSRVEMKVTRGLVAIFGAGAVLFSILVTLQKGSF